MGTGIARTSNSPFSSGKYRIAARKPAFQEMADRLQTRSEDQRGIAERMGWQQMAFRAVSFTARKTLAMVQIFFGGLISGAGTVAGTVYVQSHPNIISSVVHWFDTLLKSG